MPVTMATYYQKHRTIQAIQFDGTWQQLIPILINRPQLCLDPHITNTKYTFDHHQFIATVSENNIIWPKHKQKINHPKNFWRHKYHHRFNGELKVLYQYKYVTPPKILHRGDYLVVKTRCYQVPLLNRYYYQPGSSRASYRTMTSSRLQIIPQAHFEAHWSKTPLIK